MLLDLNYWNPQIKEFTVLLFMSLKKAEDSIDVQTEQEGMLKGKCADEN
jgi:hypothetical protein